MIDSSGRIKLTARETAIEFAESLKIIGRADLANGYAKRVLESSPNIRLPEVQRMRGRAAIVMDDKELALSSFHKANSLDRDNYWVNKALKQLRAN